MKENAIACPETIKKRNGTPVPFDVNKIRSAIHKANEAAQIEAIAPVQFEKLVDEVVESIPAGEVPVVDQVQALVEVILIVNGFANSAKAYFLYRAENTKVR